MFAFKRRYIDLQLMKPREFCKLWLGADEEMKSSPIALKNPVKFSRESFTLYRKANCLTCSP